MKTRMMVRALLVALTLLLIVYAYTRIVAYRHPIPAGCGAPRR